MKNKVFIMCVLFAICCSGCGTKTEMSVESVVAETTVDNEYEMSPPVIKVIEEGNKTTEELVERFFGISESKYEVAEVNNGLTDVYGGSFRVVLNVKKEDMPSFVEELEKRMGEPIDQYSHEAYLVYGKNVKGEELEENDVFYKTVCFPLREFDTSEGRARSAGLCAIYSNEDTDVYEVILKYLE